MNQRNSIVQLKFSQPFLDKILKRVDEIEKIQQRQTRMQNRKENDIQNPPIK